MYVPVSRTGTVSSLLCFTCTNLALDQTKGKALNPAEKDPSCQSHYLADIRQTQSYAHCRARLDLFNVVGLML